MNATKISPLYQYSCSESLKVLIPSTGSWHTRQETIFIAFFMLALEQSPHSTQSPFFSVKSCIYQYSPDKGLTLTETSVANLWQSAYHAQVHLCCGLLF